MSSVRSTTAPSDDVAFQDRAERERYRRARAHARRLHRADSARSEHSVAPPTAGASPLAEGWPVRLIAAAPSPFSPAPAPAPERPKRIGAVLVRLGVL